MRTLALALPLAAVLAGAAAAALMPRPVPIYDHAPARAHAPLGEIRVVAIDRPPGVGATLFQAGALAAEARARHGRAAGALIHARHETLPGGGLLSTATVVGWTR